MASWRKLHAKILESQDFNSLPTDFDRLTWTLLPLALDRDGRGIDDAAWLKSKLFPLRRDLIYEQLDAAMTAFAERCMIERYEVDQQKYFQVPTWLKYQTIHPREAKSNLPAPHGMKQGKKKASQRLAEGKPITTPDVDVDVDRDGETPTAPNGAGVAPKSDGKSEIVVRRKDLKAIEGFFAETSGLPIPARTTDDEKKSAAKRWWGPLRRIMQLADCDLDRAKSMVRAAITHMRSNQLTLSAPQSIEHIVLDEYAKQKSGVIHATRQSNPGSSPNAGRYPHAPFDPSRPRVKPI